MIAKQTNYRKLQTIWKLKVKNPQILNHILYVLLHARTRNSTISLRALSMLKKPASATGLRKLPPCSGDRAGNSPAVGRKFGYQLMYLGPLANNKGTFWISDIINCSRIFVFPSISFIWWNIQQFRCGKNSADLKNYSTTQGSTKD